MNAICLVVDRLHAGCVGAYGNAWIETPAFDRLAAQSLVFDRAMVDSPHLDRLYRSYWQGWHALCPAAPETRLSLAGLLRGAGIATRLLTDERRVARHPLAGDFDEITEIDPPWQPKAAREVEETHLAKCFVRIIQRLESAREPFLLWCHLGGLGTAWDAPPSFREAYCEPGDPPPPTGADVPDYQLAPDYDPDELFGTTQAYAGQVTLLDTCLGACLEFLDGLPAARETLLAVVSSRGFPLGEHGRVGPCDEALYGELVHMPWLLRFPDGTAAAERRRALIEPADLWATLLDWWGVESTPHSPTARSLMPLARNEALAARDRLCLGGEGGQRAIATPAWYLRQGPAPQLFAKPDDRWEVNDVATRCQDVVEGLQDALLQFELSLPDGRAADLPPLDDVLRDGLA